MIRAESSLSKDATPLIQTHEAEGADDAICIRHKGLIARIGAAENTVFWCPIGRQYWRYKKQSAGGFNSPLAYPKSGVT